MATTKPTKTTVVAKGERPASGATGSKVGAGGNGRRPPEQPITETGGARGAGADHQPPRGHGREQRGLGYVPVSKLYEGRFGRMFRLPPYVPSAQRIADIAATMKAASPETPAGDNNPAIPAGYTYLGQFIDHDLTFDPVSSLTQQNDPDALTDFRSPRFDLDNVYGRGPSDDPFMYDKHRRPEGYLIIGEHDGEKDLPRNAQDTAIIGDPRNDENIFIAQLQITMMTFHNTVMDQVVADPTMRRGSESVFQAAQRLVRWHYQWVVVHDFLRRTVGDMTLRRVLNESGHSPILNLEFYSPHSAKTFLPVEFSVAAYRFGHSQVRAEYHLNTLVGPLPIFMPGNIEDPANLRRHFGGFRKLPPFWTIEWRRFFDVPDAPGDGPMQFSRFIDTQISPPLTDLPFQVASDPSSLILRNLTRGAMMSLPSGQDVAAAMGERPLSKGDLALPGGGPAPLWYYLLKEAEVVAGGRHLGPVGGRIVAEVFLGLLAADSSSYLHTSRAWRPTLHAANPGDFTMPDLLRFANHGMGVTDLPRP